MTAQAGDRRHLMAGIALLALFGVVLLVFFLPLFNGRTGMEAADDLFNSLSKGSSYYIPQVADNAHKYEGTAVAFKVKAEDAELGQAVAKVFSLNGAKAEYADAKVTIEGDMGVLAAAAAADAEMLYKNDMATLESKYGMDARMAVYAWYQGFSALQKSAQHDGDMTTASFAKKVMTKALEPAYNFAGIPAYKFSEKLALATFLLAFYVIYTMWYGFGVMYIFEGLGISASKGH
ncbi:hypothetical protein ACP3TJ_12415 [Desulforudis sp. 1088]|uniref:hypothetical protein n=1 Tax=unclassified Candidatus Desulforudis TaxID=2635950 RepID=UPI003CE4A6F0